jgi:hypothetical protein
MSIACGSVTATSWNLAGHEGSHYAVRAVGVSCSLARKWVPGLIKQIVSPSSYKLKPPATGWQCAADRPPKTQKAYGGGGCTKIKSYAVLFNWSPAFS